MLVLGCLLEEEEGEGEDGTVRSRLVRKATGSGRLTNVMKLGPFGNTTSSADAWLLVERDGVCPCETCPWTESCDRDTSLEFVVTVGDDVVFSMTVVGVVGEVWIGEGLEVSIVVEEVT